LKKKILLTGGSGLLATNWALSLADDFDVVLGLHQKKIFLKNVNTIVLDMETVDGFSQSLESCQPDVVIHCAGLANVEACEANPVLAKHVNVDLSVNVALACKQCGVQLVYISTDHLFAGDRELVSEDEPTNPVNEYGKTKLEAEKKVLQISDFFLAVRTNFYGWGPSYRRSFSDMIIDNLREGKRVSLFEDFFYTPILIEELAQTVMLLLQNKATGIYHITGNERISKYEFGMRLAERFGLDTTLVEATKFADRKDLVKRPRDLSLSNKKAEIFLNRQIGDVNYDMERLYQQEQTGVASLMKSI
jgi:dTDP-4-dehydrorhamnose reductase